MNHINLMYGKLRVTIGPKASLTIYDPDSEKTFCINDGTEIVRSASTKVDIEGFYRSFINKERE